MLRALIRFSIREPLIMFCVTAVLVGFGWMSKGVRIFWIAISYKVK